MFAFIVRRIFQAILVMLVISLVGFSIKNKIGDPVRDLVGERVTPAEREAMREGWVSTTRFSFNISLCQKQPYRAIWGCRFFIKNPPWR